MNIIKRAAINEYVKDNPQAKVGLFDWFTKVQKADWKDFNDMKKTFNSVDYVGNDRYVFNISGNGYRLVALVIFKPHLVYIRRIMTHSEYDKLCKSGKIQEA